MHPSLARDDVARKPSFSAEEALRRSSRKRRRKEQDIVQTLRCRDANDAFNALCSAGMIEKEDVPADGRCCYHAIAKIFTELPGFVRRRVVEHLASELERKQTAIDPTVMRNLAREDELTTSSL